MSTTMYADSATEDPSEKSERRDERRSRGTLKLDRRVVEKIAAQAAREVPAAGGRSGGVLGIGAHADTSALPKVEVDLTGQTARLEVEVAVTYPDPISKSAENVRSQIMSRVNQLTGVEVSRVDIYVTATSRPTNQERTLR